MHVLLPGCRRRIGRGAGKAIIATAHKRLKIIDDTLKNGWVFGDLTTFTSAGNKRAAGQAS